MKVILSRKGIDDQFGKGASPILPDGTMLSYPIPEENGIPYDRLQLGDTNYRQLGEELGMKVTDRHPACHLDPDLIYALTPRTADFGQWKGIFGQGNAAKTQLDNQGVGPGDLFLFFGTFLETYRNTTGRIQFEKQHPRHIIFGYLLVEQALEVEQVTARHQKIYSQHPHLAKPEKYPGRNKVFIGTDRFFDSDKKGFGQFKFREELVLTKSGYKKSVWELPDFFHPDQGTTISYHQPKRFREKAGKVLLQTVGMGQDFVVAENERVQAWAKDLVIHSECIPDRLVKSFN